MADREKLIELIGSTRYGNSLVGENFQEGFIAKIADNLIANGATIPVRCEGCKFGEMCSIREAMACTTENGFCWRGERKDNGGIKTA